MGSESWPRLLLLLQLPVIQIISFIALPPATDCNQYVGGPIGAAFDKVTELACHALDGSLAACGGDDENALSRDRFRMAYEKLHMLAEQTRSIASHLERSADKNDEESLAEAYNIYQDTRQKLEAAIEHAYYAADKMLDGDDSETARRNSHEIYRKAMEILITAAEKAKVSVGDDFDYLMEKYGPLRSVREEVAKEVQQREGNDAEFAEMEANLVANLASANDAAERENGGQQPEEQKEEEADFDLIQDSYKRIAEAAAGGIIKTLEVAGSVGSEIIKNVVGDTSDDAVGLQLNDAPLEIKSGNKNGETSLQKAEEAFYQEHENPSKALLKAKEAGAKLEAERSINPEYLDANYIVPTQKSAEPSVINLVKGGLEKAASIGSEAFSTITSSDGNFRDSNSDESDGSTNNRDWASVDEREEARVQKTAAKLLKQDKARSEL